MLINISRFVNVQRRIKERVEEIHTNAYRSVKYNLSHDFSESMTDPVLQRIYNVYKTHYGNCGATWNAISSVLYSSIENIQIKVVNSTKGSEKLEYPKNESLRVIAIGGLALSRGLTLEGLVISYFYRNTSTYDVLMQMGRWFGYRRGYEDLFRIWTHKASAEWYSEIADATEELKNDMYRMREIEQKPRDFGIRVRNDSAELRITAYNKMRNATDEYNYSSYFGDIVETPYLTFTPSDHIQNYRIVEELCERCISKGLVFDRQTVSSGKGHYIIQDIPKSLIIELIGKLKISRFSSDFDPKQIAAFLSNCTDPSIDVFDIAFMEGGSREANSSSVNFLGKTINKVIRTTCVIDKESNRLSIGRKGKLGGTTDGISGIVDFNGKSASNIIESAKSAYRDYYKRETGNEFSAGKTFPLSTWFRFVKDRKPLLLIYFIDVDIDKEESNQRLQIEDFRRKLNGTPVVGFALGLPRNDSASGLAATKYKANRVYNWFEKDEILAEVFEE